MSLQEFEEKYPSLKGKNTKLPNKEELDYATQNGWRWFLIKDTQKAQKRVGGEYRQYYNIGLNGNDEVSANFAIRPGWHAGSLPTMRQIDKGTNRDLRDDSFVWVEGEVSAD